MELPIVVTTDRYDVIVVLGAKPQPDGKAVPAMIRRVRHGVRLFHEGAADHLLMSGGRSEYPTVEAVLMRALAVEGGVPERSIVMEGESSRTLENAFYSIALMKENGWARALVVTDKFHLPRALFAFRCFGMKARGSSPADYWGQATFGRRVRLTFREAMSLIVYAAFFLFRQADRIAVKNRKNGTGREVHRR